MNFCNQNLQKNGFRKRNIVLVESYSQALVCSPFLMLMFPFLPYVFFLFSVTSFFLLECLLLLFIFIELASIMAKFQPDCQYCNSSPWFMFDITFHPLLVIAKDLTSRNKHCPSQHFDCSATKLIGNKHLSVLEGNKTKLVHIMIGEKNHCVIRDGIVLAHLKT